MCTAVPIDFMQFSYCNLRHGSSSGWPHSLSSISASQMLGLQVCVTKSDTQIFLKSLLLNVHDLSRLCKVNLRLVCEVSVQKAISRMTKNHLSFFFFFVVSFVISLSISGSISIYFKSFHRWSG